MDIALVGLGRMGSGMATRLIAAGHSVLGVDTDAAARERVSLLGARTADSVAGVTSLPSPRIVWLMLKSGPTTHGAIDQLAGLLEAGDLVVDGGNSDFREAGECQRRLGARGVGFADVGVSGGRLGSQNGYGLMVGARREDYERLVPVLAALAGESRASLVGDVGSGHLVKAIHNAVQYAILQAYAEGYALLRAHDGLDVVRAMRAWQEGSSIRSFLLEQMIAALADDPDLAAASTRVTDSGMGRWTAEEAVRLAVPTPILSLALHSRFASRSDGAANRLLTASRDQIGGKA